MNICFRVKDAATEKEFLEGAEARMLQGLKGHRSVGGIRYVTCHAAYYLVAKETLIWAQGEQLQCGING